MAHDPFDILYMDWDDLPVQGRAKKKPKKRKAAKKKAKKKASKPKPKVRRKVRKARPPRVTAKPRPKPKPGPRVRVTGKAGKVRRKVRKAKGTIPAAMVQFQPFRGKLIESGRCSFCEADVVPDYDPGRVKAGHTPCYDALTAPFRVSKGKCCPNKATVVKAWDIEQEKWRDLCLPCASGTTYGGRPRFYGAKVPEELVPVRQLRLDATGPDALTAEGYTKEDLAEWLNRRAPDEKWPGWWKPSDGTKKKLLEHVKRVKGGVGPRKKETRNVDWWRLDKTVGDENVRKFAKSLTAKSLSGWLADRGVVPGKKKVSKADMVNAVVELRRRDVAYERAKAREAVMSREEPILIEGRDYGPTPGSKKRKRRGKKNPWVGHAGFEPEPPPPPPMPPVKARLRRGDDKGTVVEIVGSEGLGRYRVRFPGGQERVLGGDELEDAPVPIGAAIYEDAPPIEDPRPYRMGRAWTPEAGFGEPPELHRILWDTSCTFCGMEMPVGSQGVVQGWQTACPHCFEAGIFVDATRPEDYREAARLREERARYFVSQGMREQAEAMREHGRGVSRLLLEQRQREQAGASRRKAWEQGPRSAQAGGIEEFRADLSAFISRMGSMSKASKPLRVSKSQLSRIVRGLVPPAQEVVDRLRAELGKDPVIALYAARPFRSGFTREAMRKASAEKQRRRLPTIGRGSPLAQDMELLAEAYGSGRAAARAIGISRGQWHNVLAGRRTPSKDFVDAVFRGIEELERLPNPWSRVRGAGEESQCPTCGYPLYSGDRGYWSDAQGTWFCCPACAGEQRGSFLDPATTPRAWNPRPPEDDPIRWDLVRHLREQIERDPEGYANLAKLSAAGARMGDELAELRAEVGRQAARPGFPRRAQEWDAEWGIAYLLPGGLSGASLDDFAQALFSRRVTAEQVRELGRRQNPGATCEACCLTWIPPTEARDVDCPTCHAFRGRCCRTKRGGVAGDHRKRKEKAARIGQRTVCDRCRGQRPRKGNPWLASVGNPPEKKHGNTPPLFSQKANEPLGAGTKVRLSGEGVEEAAKRYELFHGQAPEGCRVVQIDDGKPGVTQKVVVALGDVPETHYTTPWPSNKEDYHWVHKHPRDDAPLEVLDPATELTFKIPGTKTKVTDWWYD